MTVRIWYELNNDMQYMSIFYEDQFEKTRHFVAGEGVVVPRGQLPPKEVKHAISTIALQELLDELIAFGLRPSNNKWAAGHVQDLKAHIGFAEQVAFKLLEKSNG